MRQQQTNDNFIDMMQQETAALKSDIDRRLIQKAVQHHNLSWAVIREESEQFVVDKLQYIDHLNNFQCIELYQAIKKRNPQTVLHLINTTYLWNAHVTIFYKFLSRCMWLYTVLWFPFLN